MEEVKEEQVPLPLSVREGIDFIDSLKYDHQQFLTYFLVNRTCFRCVLMLFGEGNLQIYRIQDFKPLYDHLKLPMIEGLCALCQGVNQHCHLHVARVCEEVKKQGFEFDDFKITFSITVVAYLNKLRML